jgi:hypothetical protein
MVTRQETHLGTIGELVRGKVDLAEGTLPYQAS